MSNTQFVHCEIDNNYKLIAKYITTNNEIITKNSLDDLPIKKQHKLIILVSSNNILLTSVDIPTKNYTHLMQAIPYSLEDKLADNVENLHFAISGIKSKQKTVAIIEHKIFEYLLKNVKKYNPNLIIPDILAVPFNKKNTWSELKFANLSLIRTSLNSGFTVENKYLKLANIDKQQNIINCNSFVEKNIYPLELRQGIYRQKNKLLPIWNALQPTIILLTIWLIMYVILTNYEFYNAKNLQKSLNTEIENIYRKTFPNTRHIVNPKVQMERKLIELKKQQNNKNQQSTFLNDFVKIQHSLTKISNFTIKNIEYRQTNFILEIELENLQKLDLIKQQLEKAKFKVEINSANNKNNRVISKLIITKT
jgi:general secretion pathway protein L